MLATAALPGQEIEFNRDIRPILSDQCFACHGPEGNSQNPDYPVLAGQTWRYTYIELKDFKEGRRSDPQMSPMAANLSRDDVTLTPFMAKPSDPRAARLNLLIARAKSLRAETPLTTIPPRAARP